MAVKNRKSIYAGILIGIGDIIYLSLDNKILAAFLFSLGLLTVINQQLNLYTGKIGFHNLPILEYIKMFFGNVAGISGICIIGFMAKPLLISHMKEVSYVKFSHSYIEMLMLGILCGMCMYIAVSCKKFYITIMAIMVFILCGFEHCIADIPYYLVNVNLTNTIKLLMVILGNSIGSIFLNMLEK